MKCNCNDQRHDVRTAMWHRAYCAWYDHRESGHRIRAAVLGWAADRLVALVPNTRTRKLAQGGTR